MRKVIWIGFMAALAIASIVWAKSQLQDVLVLGEVKIQESTSSQPLQKFFTPKVSGGGTVDTVFVWRGAANSLTDDNAVLAISALDTTLAYHLEVAIKVSDQVGVVRYGIFYPTIAANQDVDQCSFCNGVLSDCTGTTGADAKFSTCMYTSGANGLVEFENRMGSTVRLTWTLIGGG